MTYTLNITIHPHPVVELRPEDLRRTDKRQRRLEQQDQTDRMIRQWVERAKQMQGRKRL